jgi:hypothetical protein
VTITPLKGRDEVKKGKGRELEVAEETQLLIYSMRP